MHCLRRRHVFCPVFEQVENRYLLAGSTSIITTVAGEGYRDGYNGDGGRATAAELDGPYSVAVDSLGNLFIADLSNNVIREVNHATGVITTVAGNGTAGNTGDGGPATAAEASTRSSGVAVDSEGNILIADTLNAVIREVNHTTGVITTVAGDGNFGYSGDGGPATDAMLGRPQGIARDSEGDIFIADPGDQVIRKVNLTSGMITTVAGDGNFGGGGDGGPATDAQLRYPSGVAVDSVGDVFIADYGNSAVREVNHVTGVITTVVGDGNNGYSGDGGPATDASLDLPVGIGLDTAGDLFIADTYNNVIREVNQTTGVITTVAGDGTGGYSGDGGPATAAELSRPEAVVVDAQGDLFIADVGNDVVREVSATATPTPIPTSLAAVSANATTAVRPP